MKTRRPRFGGVAARASLGVVCCAALVAACGRDRAGAPATPSAYFRCGADAVALTTQDDDALLLSWRGTAREFGPAEAASGARYVALDDSTTVFWTKGDEATLVLEGGAPTDCDRISGEFAALRATGNEPSWRLDFGAGELRFRALGDDTALVAPGWTIAADSVSTRVDGDGVSLSATIVLDPCADTMTGMPYPFTVTVVARGRTWRGCGGPPAMLLRGGEWRVDSLGGRAVLAGTTLSLRFSASGRVTGDASCNRYTSDYAVTGEGIGIARARTTRMACARELWDQEDAFLALLADAQRFEVRADGVLVLAAPSGMIVARR